MTKSTRATLRTWDVGKLGDGMLEPMGFSLGIL